MARDLIVLAEDWGGLPTSTQHIIRNLPGKRRILWVNSVGLRRPRLTRHDISRLVTKAKEILLRKQSSHKEPDALTDGIPEGMKVMSPRVIPWPGLNKAFKINQKMLGRQLHRLARSMRLENPVLWIAFPTGLVAVSAGLQDKTIYYCADDYGALAGVDHEPVFEMEKQLVKEADLVFATSETLYKKFPREKTELLLHGVDLKKFQTPSPRAPDLPDVSKIAGFYGSLKDWIDIELLWKAAQDLPQWTFVLIGEVHTDISRLESLPNVRFLGPRKHHELPNYVQHWNVSMIPFKDTPQIRACNPLKLREYLAAGTPIASIDFPALEPYRHLVAVATDRDNFAKAILQADTDHARQIERHRSVTGESWRERAEQAHEIIEAL